MDEKTEPLLVINGDEKQQRILMLRLQGYSVEEVANEVSLSERTVKRVLQKVRDLWQEMFAAEDTRVTSAEG